MNKIKVRHWSGFLATFEHAGGIARNFGESLEDVIQSIRRRHSIPGAREAEVDISAAQETPPSFLSTAAERALSFLSGLNLQDHSPKEQKEHTEVVHGLLKALRPERYGK